MAFQICLSFVYGTHNIFKISCSLSFYNKLTFSAFLRTNIKWVHRREMASLNHIFTAHWRKSNAIKRDLAPGTAETPGTNVLSMYTHTHTHTKSCTDIQKPFHTYITRWELVLFSSFLSKQPPV